MSWGNFFKSRFFKHDYKKDISEYDKTFKQLYSKAKEINKQFFEKNIELYISQKKIQFSEIYSKKGS